MAWLVFLQFPGTGLSVQQLPIAWSDEDPQYRACNSLHQLLCVLTSCLNGRLFTGSFSSNWLTSGLLGRSHDLSSCIRFELKCFVQLVNYNGKQSSLRVPVCDWLPNYTKSPSLVDSSAVKNDNILAFDRQWHCSSFVEAHKTSRLTCRK